MPIGFLPNHLPPSSCSRRGSRRRPFPFQSSRSSSLTCPPRAAGRRPADSFASGKHRLVCSCSAAAVVELEPGRGGALLSTAAARSGGGRGAGRREAPTECLSTKSGRHQLASASSSSCIFRKKMTRAESPLIRGEKTAVSALSTSPVSTVSLSDYLFIPSRFDYVCLYVHLQGELAPRGKVAVL